MAFLQAQLQPYSLNGAGAVLGATSITLKSFQTIDGVNLAMTDFGSVGYGTLEPGSGTLEEQISFTGVVQNSNGTATLTGVKTVLFLSPYTETSGLAKTHAGSTSFVISNTAGYYEQFGKLQNNSAITGYWTAPDPIGNTDIANRQWVLSVVNGGTVSVNGIIVAGKAGETLVAGNLVYLKTADGYWWKTDADTASTVENVQLGIAQSSGTAGNTITGGVLIEGVDTNNTGTGGALAYASNTAGGISSSTGTTEKVVGQFIVNSGGIYFNPGFYYIPTAIQKAAFPSTGEKQALAGGSTFGTPSSSNKYITQDYNSSATGIPVVRTYLNAASPATWTKPAGLKYVTVEVQAAGGAGASGTDSGGTGFGGGGGGGGGYSKKLIAVASLGATETVTIGASGSSSSFGSLVSATSGTNASGATRGTGGIGSSGDINCRGGDGSSVTTNDGHEQGGNGGNSVLGGAGGGGGTGTGTDGGAYGGGGGGGKGSGGGASNGGAGGVAIVIVSEYYS